MLDCPEAAAIVQAAEKQPARGRPSLRPDAERNALVEANVRLVYAVLARLGLNDHRAVEDLEAAGLVGLIRACELFDPGRGYALSTFADFHIRRAVLLEWERADLIRVPAHVHGEERRELRAKLRPVGLDRVRGRDGEAELLADRRHAGALEGIDVRAAIGEALARLPVRWARVVRWRYLETPRLLLEQVAEALGVSRPRAGQIEAQALAELRRVAPELAGLIDEGEGGRRG
jgi:RNA polymerase sigma factor (sigma-70 family)